jgi:succinate dehydrogenase / fumarate reductase membrane anchor subunit
VAATTSAGLARQPVTTRNLETWAWLFMRWSGVLLIPLAWIHVALNDVLIGVHRIDLDYVSMRWALLGWRVFDAALLALAFSHGVNGLRQVVDEYVHNRRLNRGIKWAMWLVWAGITTIGAIALIGGVRQ